MSRPRKSHSWLVCGPVRSGSMLVAEYIRHSYYQWDLPVRLRRQLDVNGSTGGGVSEVVLTKNNLELYRQINAKNKKIRRLDIVHTHDYQYYNYINKNTRCVFLTRNITETCLSWVILPYVNNLTLYSTDECQIKPFKLSLKLLDDAYSGVTHFYKSLNIPSNSIIIDYSEYSSNVNQLSKLLNLKLLKPINNVDLPVKTPGPYSKWFTNWDEIQKYIKYWENDPKKFIRP